MAFGPVVDDQPVAALPGSEAVQREFARRLRKGDPFSLCYLDLDYFKPFNDHFGFAIADEVIREAGDAISAAAAGRGARRTARGSRTSA